MNEPTSVESYPVRLDGQGQITVPKALRERFAVTEGDELFLVDIEGMIFLSSKNRKWRNLLTNWPI